ncbi:hypothetical protein EPUL_004376, partial [Erysiphe pulchra]
KLTWSTKASIFRLPDEVFKNPHQYIYHTKFLTKLATQYRKKQIEKEIVPEISEDGEAQIPMVKDTNTHFPQKTHWNLRRRSSNDKSDEPYSAPSGIIAQKTENFQKFYRAVVSPTHVRVTAGGRIVPNTRPTENFELNSCGEKPHLNAINLEPTPVSLHTTSWPQLQPVQMRYPIVLPPSVSTPYNILQSSNLNTISPLPTQANLDPSIDWNPAERSQISNNDVSPTVSSRETTIPQGIKISHPSQFDQTKPFVLNGQLLYPLKTNPQVPSHAYSIPTSMYGSASSVPHGHHPVFQQASTPSALGNMTNSVSFPYSSQPPLHNLQSGLNFDLGPTPPYMLSTGLTIASANILIDQLRNLSNILVNLEYQIDSKNSQYDGGFLEAQRNSIKSQINSIKNALTFHFPEELKAENNDTNDEILRMSNSPINSKDSAIATSDQTALTSKLEIEQQDLNTFDNNSKNGDQFKLSTKSRLSISSAKAPPFQPRSLTAIETSAKKQINLKTTNIKPTESVSQNFQNSITKVLKGSIKLKDENLDLRGSSFTQPQTSIYKSAPSVPTYDHSQNQCISFMGPNTKNLEAPYLVGTFPNGSHYNPSRPFDVIYSRPLNDEEIRARYLYFGKVPRNSQSGLPKFDGKDFYPPSPKRTPRQKSSHLELNNPAKGDLIEANPYNATTSTEAYKCNINSSIRSSQSLQNLNSLTQSQLDPDNDDFRTVSPQVTKSLQNKQIFRSHTLRNTKHIHRVKADKFADHFMMDGRVELKSSLNKQAPNHNLQENVPILFPPSKGVESYPKETQIIHDQNTVLNKQVSSKPKAGSPSLGKVESQTTNPTIKIQISPKMKVFSSNAGNLFSGRVEGFRSANQQTLFLQNMLKRDTPILPLLGSALSGAITSENACGYLPQYRGSAIASFFPTKLPNISGVEVKCLVNKNTKIHQTEDLPSCGVSGISPNSSRFNSDERLRHPVFAIGPVAANYMRSLTQRDLSERNSSI